MMNLQDKIKSISGKTQLSAEKRKGENGNVSLNSMPILHNKIKLISTSALVFFILLIVSMFSGERSYSLDTLSAPFPSDGDITEGCESIVYLKYDYYHLVNDGVKPSEITAALNLALNRLDKATYPTLPSLEKQYYKELQTYYWYSKEITYAAAGTIKERSLDISRYEKILKSCIAMNV